MRKSKIQKQYKIKDGRIDWGFLMKLEKFFGKIHPHTQEKARRVRQMESGFLPMVAVDHI